MLRCPQCGNEDEFIVAEKVWQRSRISCDSDGQGYTYIETVEFLDLDEWGGIDCASCNAFNDEGTLRQAYEDARSNDPIPYTLDASIT